MINNDDQQNYNTFHETAVNSASAVGHVAPSSLTSSSLPAQKSFYWRLFYQNRLVVMMLCYCYASFGMCVAILGPVLLDLSCLTSSTLRAISWLFFFQTFLFSGGSALVGYLVTKEIVSDESIMLVSMSLLPITMVLVPFGHSLAVLAINLTVMGLILGIIENLCNIKMIDIFKDKVAPFLQALHFFYGFGAFLTPFISKPFLLNQDCTLLLKNATQKFRVIHGINYTVSVDSIKEARDLIQVQYAFAIVAALMLPGIALVVAYGVQVGRWKLFWRGKGDDLKTKQADAGGKSENGHAGHDSFELDYTSGPGTTHNPSDMGKQSGQAHQQSFFASIGFRGKHVIAVTVLSGLVNLIYDGLQATFSDFGYTYAVDTVKYLEGRRSEAAYTESVFWGSFALGRLLSIFFAAYFFPTAMIAAQMVCLIITVLFLMTVDSFGSIHLLLFCFFILGLCISSIVPSCFSQAAQFINMTPTLTTALVIGASLGETLFPVVVGTLIDGYGPRSYMSFSLLAAILALVLFIALTTIGRRTPKFMTSGQTSVVFWNSDRAAGTAGDSAAVGGDLAGSGFYSQLKDEEDDD